MNQGIVRVTIHLRPEEGLSWDEGLITHDFQTVINDVFVDRKIVGVFIEHLNWFTAGRGYVEGPPDQVDRAVEAMREDPRLIPYFSKTVFSPPRVPSEHEAGSTIEPR